MLLQVPHALGACFRSLFTDQFTLCLPRVLLDSNIDNRVVVRPQAIGRTIKVPKKFRGQSLDISTQASKQEVERKRSREVERERSRERSREREKAYALSNHEGGNEGPICLHGFLGQLKVHTLIVAHL